MVLSETDPVRYAVRWAAFRYLVEAEAEARKKQEAESKKTVRRR